MEMEQGCVYVCVCVCVCVCGGGGVLNTSNAQNIRDCQLLLFGEFLPLYGLLKLTENLQETFTFFSRKETKT